MLSSWSSKLTELLAAAAGPLEPWAEADELKLLGSAPMWVKRTLESAPSPKSGSQHLLASQGHSRPLDRLSAGGTCAREVFGRWAAPSRACTANHWLAVLRVLSHHQLHVRRMAFSELGDLQVRPGANVCLPIKLKGLHRCSGSWTVIPI